ncbi:kinase-like domain-containing protein [Gymnopilus junonius]|uniref:non-specific serine/threonine protein kinase n=1 Tax=Gymnopilus junonius TaxID=109634 RepID=A0A9P5NP50_GYMJU|nr:kinase-like domain-containing protein [Gymnopilus junonius]
MSPSPNTRTILSSRPSTEEEDEEQWQPILHASNQVVLYNPRSHALSITPASGLEPMVSGVVVARRLRREESSSAARVTSDLCPYCKQTLPPGFIGFRRTHPGTGESSRRDEEDDDVLRRWGHFDTSDDDEDEESADIDAVSTDPAYHARASDYFRLLEVANETSSAASGSRRASISGALLEPRVGAGADEAKLERRRTQVTKMAEGYFETFFQEEYKLGMGANGSVFLCQHMLDGHSLGHFAVKKIAVGESHSYLFNILREVRLLERLHHPNIITYHHAWLENAQFSSFGPKVPTLHVLMQWAEGGSLDDFIDVRLGRKPAHIHMHPLLSSSSIFNPSAPSSPPSSFAELASQIGDSQHPQSQHANSKPEDPQSRSARIKAFRAYQRAPPEEKERIKREMEESQGSAPGPRRGEWKPVHLLSAEEVKSLFNDVVAGLAFLHDRSILHLDLKPGNVLLTWDEGQLIPRAMLSDFGTSRDMINSHVQYGQGTLGRELEYAAPETLPSPQTGLLQQIDSKADMWSLGMILHKMLFFKLPYRYYLYFSPRGEKISNSPFTSLEGEKMERLEREVADYPGFKSNTVLVTGFEGRRLPRSFLVLLETLLHKVSASRPSCDRVKVAIQEGKFDPLGPSPSLTLARPWTVSSASQISEERSEAPISGSPPLLALPSPVEILGPAEVLYRKERPRKKKKRNGIVHRGGRSGLSLRLLRSTLLVIKVLTIPRICPDPLTHPRPVIATLLLAAAVVDTVIDYDVREEGV